MATLFVGTSGWRYPHWIGPVYPPGTRPHELLPLYARRFRTVEINTTFYGLPKAEAVTTWREATPPGFVFACKGSRYLTHMKKLREPAAGLARFFAVVGQLGAKLGPVLFQLPPRWHADPGRLRAFLDALPPGHRYAFEFRDPAWFEAAVYAVLAERGAACCVYDLGGVQSPIERTGDFVYVRLHGPGGPYQGRYDDRVLAAWAARFRSWLGAGSDVFCYFDNDEQGFAVADAARLSALIEDGACSPGA